MPPSKYTEAERIRFALRDIRLFLQELCFQQTGKTLKDLKQAEDARWDRRRQQRNAVAQRQPHEAPYKEEPF